ncbi:MAG: ComF family protein [Candidatus Colwellbacteria bacterium]|nr:ComF family protein [Candidatus Colwellbacteria bacterium]
MVNKIISCPQYWINQILDTVFPKVCVGCGKFTGSHDFDYVCRKCFKEIKTKSQLECIGCKRHTNLGFTCVFCQKDNPIDQLLITTDLAHKLVDKTLKVYKYEFIPDIYKPLSVLARKSIKKLIAKGFNLFDDNPLITAVPLHKTRLNKRGFNQAQLIAKDAADFFHMSYVDDVLVRKYNSKNQADIKTREDRLINVRNNFRIGNSQAVKGRSVILVDDICTTGATLNECAKVLKENGAGRVVGFVIARGQFKN